MSLPREVRVRVPASSANLGPGFDTLGLALARYDDIEVTAAPDGLSVEVTGEGAASVPRDERHLVVRAMRAAFDAFGNTPAGLRLRCSNTIPQSRGLGSSAAAAVAGAVAAAVLSGRDPVVERPALLQLAAGLEGHADNAAASLLGGFVIAWQHAEHAEHGEHGEHADVWHAAKPLSRSEGNKRGFDAVRLDVHPGVHPVLMIAAQESPTEMTRRLLPVQVSLADATFSASRTALAVHAFTREPGLLLAATEDRLHQSYRRPAYPASADLVERLRGRGIASAISGAGPTVLALPVDGALPAELVGDGFTICPIEVDQFGARVEQG